MPSVPVEYARLIFQGVAAAREPLLAPELASVLSAIRTDIGTEAFDALLRAAAGSLLADTPD